jgi:hypothetical protein
VQTDQNLLRESRSISDDASFVTGHALVVDGGVCAGTGNTEGITTN